MSFPRGLLFPSLLLFSGLASLRAAPVAPSDASLPPQPAFQVITPKTAARFAPYAMMSANSYHGPKKERFPLELLGWEQIDLRDQPTQAPTFTSRTGLAYDIYQKEHGHDYVFVFRGTDGISDFLNANLSLGASPQYEQASRHFARFLATHPQAHVLVSGHSLGGGLALHVSVRSKDEQRLPVDAVVFDSSPRVFDGLGDHHRPGEREMVYQKGEVLTVARRLITKLSEVVPTKNIYQTDFDLGKTPVKRHSSQKLARALLGMGAPTEPRLRALEQALPSGAARP